MTFTVVLAARNHARERLMVRHGDPGGQLITGSTKVQSESPRNSAADGRTRLGRAEMLSIDDVTPITSVLP
jgi:hypothetical protein